MIAVHSTLAIPATNSQRYRNGMTRNRTRTAMWSGRMNQTWTKRIDFRDDDLEIRQTADDDYPSVTDQGRVKRKGKSPAWVVS